MSCAIRRCKIKQQPALTEFRRRARGLRWQFANTIRKAPGERARRELLQKLKEHLRVFRWRDLQQPRAAVLAEIRVTLNELSEELTRSSCGNRRSTACVCHQVSRAPPMVPNEKPKSRLKTDAPLCPRCKTRMKVRTLLRARVQRCAMRMTKSMRVR
jgi:hypothetical protein